MKKLLILFIILISLNTYAQSGYKSINLSYGVDLNEWRSVRVALEFNKTYYNSWELIIQGLEDEESGYEELQFGAAYKPLLVKNNDFFLHFRIGGLLGTNTDKVILGPEAGFEASIYLSSWLQLFVQQNNQYIINADNRFRHNLAGGIKLQF